MPLTIILNGTMLRNAKKQGLSSSQQLPIYIMAMLVPTMITRKASFILT